MSLARALYRSRQFFRSIGASISDDERVDVEARLTPEQRDLFFAMTPRDQRHSLDVFHRLHGRGHRDPDLLLAALLHDVGKGRVRLWHRVSFVLLRAVSPRLLRKLSDGSAGANRRFGWRQALASFSDHARRGSALVEATGAPSVVVTLVRLHADNIDHPDERVSMLRSADESC